MGQPRRQRLAHADNSMACRDVPDECEVGGRAFASSQAVRASSSQSTRRPTLIAGANRPSCRSQRTVEDQRYPIYQCHGRRAEIGGRPPRPTDLHRVELHGVEQLINSRREGRFLDLDEVAALAEACRGRYAELVYVLALQGLRWGELAGLQVGDRVVVPGPGLRLSRAVLASNGGGELYVDTLKNKRARTVPLVPAVAPIVDRWSAGKSGGEWLFAAPAGGPLRETNWQRSVGWREATATIGRPELRIHDLRHTAASVWLASGADPKVVQRVLGHATEAMTMDLYGHMIDRNLWDAARLVGTTGARSDGGPDAEGGVLGKPRR
jgi:integrase